ncbi:uncharacterized protein LAJ45_08849 [Morchella importuna]|uniref:uncharacterized protein n=1 Tax=Morchella importuna TaxID=1174673 RepID=UPI001E8E0F6B|nr:uncharacterized protein LAJ45_08849 [Morchella importuna]KAH8147050.1 hypothetical protein LAJ45_08849 [Morchella importuna]
MVISNISIEATQLAKLNTQYSAIIGRLHDAIKIIKDNPSPPEDYANDKVRKIIRALTESNISYTLNNLLPKLVEKVEPTGVDPSTCNNVEPTYHDGDVLGIMERNALLICQLHLQIREDMVTSRAELASLAYQKFRVRNPDYDERELTEPVAGVTKAIYTSAEDNVQRRNFNLHLSDIEFKVKSSFKTIYYPELGMIEFFIPGLTGEPEVVRGW